MTDPRFCSNCGTPLSSTANFCAACGRAVQKPTEAATLQHESSPIRSLTAAAPVAVAAPAQQVQAAAQEYPESTLQERVVGVIPGAIRSSGFLGMKTENFVVVLTNQRILFAAQTMQMMKDNIKQARDNAEQEGKGFFGKWGAQLGANTGQQYWQIPPQQILAEQPTNFYINLDQVRSIRLREVGGDEDTTSTYYMDFHTVSGKQTYRFGGLNIKVLKKQLKELYGDIVR